MMMNSLLYAVCVLLAVGAGFAVEFSYDAQDEWPGICVTGNELRQSPIDIVEDDVVFDGDLPDLVMEDWDTVMNGTFVNMGHNVQFNPTTANPATTENQFGTYDVLQFHMHWGRSTGTGSEHTISGNANELEIHFVHSKQNNDDSTRFDALSVVAVMGEVDEDAELTGPWYQLNASAILSNEDRIDVTGFRFDSLLPENRDYYFYQGSLTTPTCDETVVWFVLRNTIKVPGAFLEQLRQVEGVEGEVLGFNYRDTQVLADREVTTNSQTVVRPLLSLMFLTLVVVGLFYY